MVDTAVMPAQKNFRLNEQLRKTFETICREHLYEERAVVEAWLLAFTAASEDERRAVAKKYADWLASQQQSARAGGSRRKA